MDRFSKNTEVKNFMIIHPVGGRVVPCEQTDGQTDVTKPIVAFFNFANAPRNGQNE